MAKVTVYFDGDCPLCAREISVMRRLDWQHAIDFQNVASPGVSCPLDRNELLARFHASENGVMLSGAAAFAAMWRVIPLLKPIGWAARNPKMLNILERLYIRFLRIRPRIQEAFRRR